MKFAEIPGHDELKRMLAAGADRGRVSHAQLFTGESGYGVLPLAVAYAQYVNCTDRQGGDSCGVCPSCRKYEELAHPDLHFVFPVNTPKGGDAKKNLSDNFIGTWRELWSESGGIFDEAEWYARIGIDNKQGLISRGEADEVVRKLSFKSFEAAYKVVVVWLPERMRPEAANALLKILEEPWERTLFLLASVSPQMLLPTILSRTQQVSVPALSESDAARWLVSRFGTDPADAASFAHISQGDLIVARRLADADGDSSREDFEMFTALMRLSYNDKHMELLQWADTAAAMSREQQKRFLAYSVRLLRDSYMINAGMDELAYVSGKEKDFCAKFSPFIGNHNVESLVNEMELARAQLTQNGNPRIIFSHFALTVSKQIIKAG